jgi:uncharacterized SAM-binding protein YcdF (DUF218 family)
VYLLKQFVGALAMPLTVAFLLALAGIVCQLLRRRRAAGWLFVAGALVAWLGSIMPVANLLARPLEAKYPPLRDDQVSGNVAAIVVLGGSYNPRGTVPVTAALDEDGLIRIVEGLRLHERAPQVRLILSGGAPRGEATPAAGYARLARELGVPQALLVLVPDALDTGDEARNVAKLLGTAPFVLVTSAYHMPRAVRLMERAGGCPVPAPTGQRVGKQEHSWRSLLPSSEALRRTERALHEYLGLLAIAIGVD